MDDLPRVTPTDKEYEEQAALASASLGNGRAGPTGSPAELGDVTLAGHSDALRPLSEPATTESSVHEQSSGSQPRTEPNLAVWRRALDGLDRINIEPGVLGGIPVVRQTRISVSQVLDTLSDEGDTASVLAQFPRQLEAEDVRQALVFAARTNRY